MRAVLRAKFSQHEALRELLLDTGSHRLVEAGTTNNAVNRFWGEVHGKGKNTLGNLLMELRDELRKERDLAVSSQSASKVARSKRSAGAELAA